MLTTRELERSRERLDTFLAAVRPAPSRRRARDISYTLTETAFILHVHQPAGDAAALTAHACFKAVHSEDPAGWLLYIPDADDHWVPCPGQVFATQLADALQAARGSLPLAEPSRPLDLAG